MDKGSRGHNIQLRPNAHTLQVLTGLWTWQLFTLAWAWHCVAAAWLAHFIGLSDDVLDIIAQLLLPLINLQWDAERFVDTVLRDNESEKKQSQRQHEGITKQARSAWKDTLRPAWSSFLCGCQCVTCATEKSQECCFKYSSLCSNLLDAIRLPIFTPAGGFQVCLCPSWQRKEWQWLKFAYEIGCKTLMHHQLALVFL